MPDYDITQLSPNYTSDVELAGTTLQELQDALAYAQANPDDPNAAYYVEQLQRSIAEQQNILAYNQGQQGLTGNVEEFKKIQSAYDYSFQTGQTLNNVFEGLSGLGLNPQEKLGEAAAEFMKTYGRMPNFGTGDDYKLAEILQTKFKEPANQVVSNYQNQINTSGQNLAGLRAPVIQGLTFAQPNYGEIGRGIETMYGRGGDNPTGLYQSYLQPAIQDIYSTAYNNKMGVVNQLQGMGLGSSGAKSQAMSGVDSRAFEKSLGAISNFNTAKAQSLQNLGTSQREQEAQYQKDIANLQSTDLGQLLGGSANKYAQSYNNTTGALTDTAKYNAASELAKQKAEDLLWSQLLGNVGTLAGTAGGQILTGGVNPSGTI